MEFTISNDTSDALDILYNQFFTLNSIFDNAVSYMLNEWCMPNASNIIHLNLAHTFPLLADKVSEIKDTYNLRSIRLDIDKHDETYLNLEDLTKTLVDNCNVVQSMFVSVFKIANENAEISVISQLIDVQKDFNKLYAQVLTLHDKAKQMPEEYDKFDRHISTWGIVGLG